MKTQFQQVLEPAFDGIDIYGRENLEDLWLTEAYLPIPVMDTLVVLLTVAEQDLFSADDEEDEGGDE